VEHIKINLESIGCEYIDEFSCSEQDLIKTVMNIPSPLNQEVVDQLRNTKFPRGKNYELMYK
jgi:hypothetical protein